MSAPDNIVVEVTPAHVVEVIRPGGPPGPPGPAGPAGATTLAALTDVTGTGGYGQSPVDDGSNTFPLTRVTTQDDLEGILTSVAEVEWHHVGDPGEPAFLSEFRNIGDPWAPARYRLTLNNVVHLEGTVTCDDQTIGAATWIPVFTFPPECAPGANIELGVISNDESLSKLIVWGDGQVVWGGYMLGPGSKPLQRLSLAGVNFSVGGFSTVLDTALAGYDRRKP